jgi:ParB/RepB/Spo0J family partition protein
MAKQQRTIIAECTARLDIGLIKPSPDNPRKHFPKEEIAQLASTLADTGPDQDIIVRPLGDKAEFDGREWKGADSYEIVDGDRRHRAAKLKGLKTLQCKVRHFTDDEAADARLISFAQRVDLLPSELAKAYAAREESGKSAADIAKAVGKSVAFVQSHLRLAKLPKWGLEAVDNGVLPRATAELIARVPGEESRTNAAACVLLGVDHTGNLDVSSATASKSISQAVLNGAVTGQLVLSYRDTRSLIHQHFTRELKAAPFDRKSLELLPAAGSCDACPSRAGNDDGRGRPRRRLPEPRVLSGQRGRLPYGNGRQSHYRRDSPRGPGDRQAAEGLGARGCRPERDGACR